MMNPFNNAISFLLNTLFDLAIFVLLVRLILASVRADYYNPITQGVIKLTQPLVGPLRRIIPHFKNIELATVLLVFIFEVIKFFLLGVILVGMPNIIGLLVLAVADMGKAIINLFFYAILLQAILSWVQSGYSPVNALLSQITRPIMQPIRRIVPPINGIDISPIPAMLILQLLIILIIGPLFSYGQVMAFG